MKINAVVMDGKNIDDIVPLIELSRKNKVDVRFIEEMPFNGEGNHYATLNWTHKKILEYIKEHYPDVYKIPDPKFSTSDNYHIPGHQGNLGIIAAFSRTFCGTCNRIRVTAQGTLKTCLSDADVAGDARRRHTEKEGRMKKILLLVLVVCVTVMALTGVALAETPQDIYNDYADNGKLDNQYTDAELEAYLNDTTVHQYGDEATLEELDTLVTSMLTNRSTFPFTGLEMSMLAIGALVLIGAGVVLRKASR